MSCRFCGFFKPEHYDRELGNLCETCLGLVEYGVDRERERIIKLLEERHRPFQNPCNNATCGIKIHTDCVTCLDDYPCLFVEEIALIKGENK